MVVITGAAGGIGRALAQACGQRGAQLALVDRDNDGLAALESALGRARFEAACSLHVLDLRDVARLPELAAEIEARYERVDVLVNNAGLTVHGTFVNHSPEEIDRVIDVDLRAAIHTTHAFLPALRRAARQPTATRGWRRRRTPGAHVAFVASMAGVLAFPFQSVYSAAKFGLRGFGQALRCELEAEGIGVTTILPGTTATGFLAAAASHDVAASTQLAELMQRYGTPPARVAEATLAALDANRAEVHVGWDCRLVWALQRLVPAALPALLAAGFERELLGRPRPAGDGE